MSRIVHCSRMSQVQYGRERRSVLLAVAMIACVAVGLHAQEPALQAQEPAPVRASTVLAKARELRASHQPEAAESLLRPYLADRPNDPEALTLLGQLRMDQGDQAGAEKSLIAALSASPNSITANLAMGDLLLSMHRNPEAMDRFETVLAIARANSDARRGELAAATALALSARRSGHPEVALQVLEHARTKLPDDPNLLLELGIQATELYLYPEAEEALNAARKLRPNDPGTLYALARMETERQHLQAAEADFRAYLAAQPGDPSAHFGLGHILAMQQRTDDARAEFERSIQLQPVQTESYYQIGEIELDAHQDAKAEVMFHKTLERDPTHAGALTGLGVLEFRAKDYVKAEQYLAAAEKAAPNYGTTHYYRGLALAHMGRKDEGDAELREATKLGTANPPAVQASPQTP
jgi:tetratricopeptide (TPR) repeat protein